MVVLNARTVVGLNVIYRRKQMNELENKIKELESENNRLKNQIKELNFLVHSLEDELIDMEYENNSLRNELKQVDDLYF